MRVKTIRAVTYGALVASAFIMFFCALIPALNSHLTIFMYIGGLLGICAMIFSVICLHYPCCSNCRQFIIFRMISNKNCPHCGENIEKCQI